MFLKNGNELWAYCPSFAPAFGIVSHNGYVLVAHNVKQLISCENYYYEGYAVILYQNDIAYYYTKGVITQIAENVNQIMVCDGYELVLLNNGDLYVPKLGIVQQDVKKIAFDNDGHIGIIKNNDDLLECKNLFDSKREFIIIERNIKQAVKYSYYLKCDGTLWHTGTHMASDIEKIYDFPHEFFLDKDYTLYNNCMGEILKNVKHMEYTDNYNDDTDTEPEEDDMVEICVSYYILTYEYDVFICYTKHSKPVKIYSDICQIARDESQKITLLANNGDVLVRCRLTGKFVKVGENAERLINYNGPEDSTYSKNVRF